MTEQYLPVTLFIINVLLILGDACLGYVVLPLIMGQGGGTDETSDVSFPMGGMLTFLVTLYMFVNCYAWFNGRMGLLWLVTIMTLADIVIQIVVRHRRRDNGRHESSSDDGE